ncbi:methyltransferase family protein [Amaricoccus macauensis]|uniref:methyltransferase family protein n=1 Tax=Amaricoccus macauensis TaxID=57001 RepID=UPI003C7B84BC
MILNLALVVAPLLIWLAISTRARRTPRHAAWPPVRGNLVTAIWAWGVTVLIYIGLIGLGTENWNPAGLPRFLTWGIGGTLTIASLVLHGVSVAELGLKATSGWDRGIYDRRSYSFMRHPQYWGQGLGFVGWGILAAEPLTLVMSLATCLVLWHLSETEERVMLARHPEAYAVYRKRVSLWRNVSFGAQTG